MHPNCPSPSRIARSADSNLPSIEVATFAVLASTLLNLDEAITRR